MTEMLALLFGIVKSNILSSEIRSSGTNATLLAFLENKDTL